MKYKNQGVSAQETKELQKLCDKLSKLNLEEVLRFNDEAEERESEVYIYPKTSIDRGDKIDKKKVSKLVSLTKPLSDVSLYALSNMMYKTPLGIRVGLLPPPIPPVGG